MPYEVRPRGQGGGDGCSTSHGCVFVASCTASSCRHVPPLRGPRARYVSIIPCRWSFYGVGNIRIASPRARAHVLRGAIMAGWASCPRARTRVVVSTFTATRPPIFSKKGCFCLFSRVRSSPAHQPRHTTTSLKKHLHRCRVHKKAVGSVVNLYPFCTRSVFTFDTAFRR